jgi:tetratricopeptide (TPR) repeat protein
VAQHDLTEWDEDVTASTEDEYAALLRAIRWAQGFSLLFVQCSPAEGERLIKRVQEDAAEKVVQVLPLESEIEDLYEVVAAYPDIDKTNVLFITGLEKSLVSYIQPGFGSQGAYYAKDTVPKLLGKLNLQRERFKQDFALCFVFLVPRYAMKYLIRRAADFFDWRSGVWEFVPPQAEQQQFAQTILQEGDFEQYLSWTPHQRRQRVQEINDLLAEVEIPESEPGSLHVKKGNILAADKNYEAALAAYDAALAIAPDYHPALTNKGCVLSSMGCYEEAIAAYNAALTVKPNYHLALFNKGNVLGKLGRYKESIAAYDAALAIKPDDHEAFYGKGLALDYLGRYEESIAAYDAALKIKPDYHQALYNKGYALDDLGRYEESIAAYDAALKIKPDKHEALNTKGVALNYLGRYEESIAAYDAALKIKPDKHEAFYNKGIALNYLGRYEEAIAAYDAALEIKPDDYAILSSKVFALGKAGHFFAAFKLAQSIDFGEEYIKTILQNLETKPKLNWRERISRFVLRHIISSENVTLTNKE